MSQSIQASFCAPPERMTTEFLFSRSESILKPTWHIPCAKKTGKDAKQVLKQKAKTDIYGMFFGYEEDSSKKQEMK
jgi:hypothetical protein